MFKDEIWIHHVWVKGSIQRYPRRYLNETKTEEDGYFKYRRSFLKNGGFGAKTKMQGNQKK